MLPPNSYVTPERSSRDGSSDSETSAFVRTYSNHTSIWSAVSSAQNEWITFAESSALEAFLTKATSGWFLHRTAPDIEEAVFNKLFLPIASFLQDEREREVCRNLRGGLVLLVLEVLPPGAEGLYQYATSGHLPLSIFV